MVIYADTSFVFSLYVQDANTSLAGKIAGTANGAFAFTPLHRHELRNAVRLSLFRRDITKQELRNVLGDIEADTKAGVLLETPVSWHEVFARAEGLSSAHTPGIGSRALDVLHVAAAMALGTRQFLTFDPRQKTLAEQAGLKVLSCESLTGSLS